MSRKPRRVVPDRQEKPWPDFPLFWHVRGYWACKREGRQIPYTADWKESYDLFTKDEEARKAGHAIPSLAATGHTVRDAINLFMDQQQQRMDAGEISDVQLAKYRRECERLAEGLGLTTRLRRLSSEEGPALFEKLRKAAVGRGLIVAERHIFYVRKLLELAHKRGLMPPAHYAESFDPPGATLVARWKIAQEQKHGERAWSVEELREIVAGAWGWSPHLFAQVLLALNDGFGADDCALLTEKQIDRKLGIIKAYRGKSARKRVCPFWPATIAAIDASVVARRSARKPVVPKQKAWAERIFLTENGYPVARKVVKYDEDPNPGERGRVRSTSRVDSVHQSFMRLLRHLEEEAAARQAWAAIAQARRERKAPAGLKGILSVEQAAAVLGREKVPGHQSPDFALLKEAGLAEPKALRAARGELEKFLRSAGFEERPLKLVKHKAGFYTLRAMFRSLAVGCGVDTDLIAVIKGQKFQRPVDEYYLRADLRAKLFAVVEHVYRELFNGWSSPWPAG